MMELGQPLHAFDLDRLAGRRIVVRTAAAGERFTTLDGRERVLEADMLMICDAEKPVAIAGVMGGQNSEIAEGTTRVLIESARFDPVSVRRTSKRLGLATDASRRFERGVDPVGAVTAADRAAMLMAEVAGGRIARGAIDAHPRPWMPQPIRLSVQSTHRLLGTRVPKNRIARLLAGIGFTVEPAPERDVLSVTAPSFRVDVGRPEDLMEEVARLAGFDTIPVTFPALPAGARTEAPRIALRRRARTIMNGCGFSEVITYSFVHAESCNRLRLAPDDPGRRTVPVLNPLAEDQSIMRPSLLPGLLETLRFNLAQQTRRVKVFEIGKVYHGRAEGELPDEPEFVAGLWCGPRRPPAWDEKDVPCDFYDAKGAIESLADGLKLEDLRFERLAPDDAPMLRPGHSARITASGRAIGRLGEVHPEVRKAYDLKQTAFVFELDLAAVEALVSAIRFRMQIPRFPAVSRDITLIVDGGLQAQAVQDAIAAMHVPHLERVQLVAVFTGDPIPAGKRSLSFRLTYRSPDQTLEDGEVNAVQQAVADRLLSELPASMSG
jgi:phenylalanyl-tRNA synthetase beta chain